SISTPILTRFFPQTECCTAQQDLLLSESGKYKHRLAEQALRAKTIDISESKILVRVDGRSKVLHQFYPDNRYPPTVSTPSIVGYPKLDTASGKIEALRLVTDGGKFDKMDLGVAVRSVP